MFDGIYGVNIADIGAHFSEENAARQYWNDLSNGMQEEINAHAEEFHSEEDIQRFIARLEQKK